MLVCSGKTGVIGFCTGGGGLTPDAERMLPRACPMVASSGARDRWPGLRKVSRILEPALTLEPSARDARRRIVAFFRTHLVDTPANA